MFDKVDLKLSIALRSKMDNMGRYEELNGVQEQLSEIAEELEDEED
ncbi:MAG: hypothetical protein M1281_14415 [Chloroflexi bacterium]|nr:hypothetical protein [Chloroflexota bacterium]